MGETIQCDQCGAVAKHEAGKSQPHKFCTYCGAAFRAAQEEVPVGASETTAEARKRRFEALRDQPDTRAALSSPPPSGGILAKYGTEMVIQIILLVFIASIMGPRCHGPGRMGRSAGMPPGFVLLPALLIGAVLLATMVKSILGGLNVMFASTESSLACVLDASVEMQGRGDRMRPVPILTLISEAGIRKTYEVHRTLSRQVAPNDMVVAYSRGDRLIGFRVLEG